MKRVTLYLVFILVAFFSSCEEKTNDKAPEPAVIKPTEEAAADRDTLGKTNLSKDAAGIAVDSSNTKSK